MLMMLDELIHVYELLSELGQDMQVAWQRLSRRGAITAIGCVRGDEWPSLEISTEIWSRQRRAGLARKSVTTKFRHIVTGAVAISNAAGQNENRLALDIFLSAGC
jgi:hypothetical protein